MDLLRRSKCGNDNLWRVKTINKGDGRKFRLALALDKLDNRQGGVFRRVGIRLLAINFLYVFEGYHTKRVVSASGVPFGQETGMEEVKCLPWM